MKGEEIIKLNLSTDELVNVGLGINYAQGFDLVDVDIWEYFYLFGVKNTIHTIFIAWTCRVYIYIYIYKAHIAYVFVFPS